MNALSLAFTGMPRAACLALAGISLLVLLALAAFAARARRSRPPSPTGAPTVPESGAPVSDTFLVLHASQTGTARSLAQATGEFLRQRGLPVRVNSLGSTGAEELRTHRRILLVLATCGDGDAPEEALPFVRQVMAARGARRPVLAGVSFGLLALGDSHYDDFCGFARRVERWLRTRGARPLFERVEVDGWNPAALARWQSALGALAASGHGVGESADGGGVTEAGAGPWDGFHSRESPARAWRLVERRLLNPDSAGEPMLHLELEPADGLAPPDWQSGDLARVAVPADPRPRDYSIASVPADARLHLTVRVSRRMNGTPGVASGWFASAVLGSELPLQLVAHDAFRLGDNARRPLVLIGNGAGIAGLRGHLRARQAHPGARHWLLLGERQRAHDVHYRDEIERWQACGTLERVDLAFSRDDGARVYVQDLLRTHAHTLRAWVADGAAIYVCGSRLGMAEGVHDTLIDVLGGPALQALAAAGRYRRDVY